MHQPEPHLTESHAAELGRQVCRPQPATLHLGLEGCHQREELVVAQPQCLERHDLFAKETAHPDELRLKRLVG